MGLVFRIILFCGALVTRFAGLFIVVGLPCCWAKGGGFSGTRGWSDKSGDGLDGDVCEAGDNHIGIREFIGGGRVGDGDTFAAGVVGGEDTIRGVLDNRAVLGWETHSRCSGEKKFRMGFFMSDIRAGDVDHLLIRDAC